MSSRRRTPQAAKAEGVKQRSTVASSTYTAPRQRSCVATVPSLSLSHTVPPPAAPATSRYYSGYRVHKPDAVTSASPSPPPPQTSPSAATSLPSRADKEVNSIYQLHHLALHRYLELGWRVHWGYQDSAPAPALTPAAAASKTESSDGLRDSLSSSGQPPTPPRTMTPRRTGAGAGGGVRATSTGCLTALEQCPFCAEEALLKNGSSGTSALVDSARGRYLTLRGTKRNSSGSCKSKSQPPALVSSQTLPARLLSLQQWVQTYMHSKDKEALRVCLPHFSLEALEYMATVGVRTGWLSMKLYAELPSPSVEQQTTPSPVASFFAISPLSELHAVSAPDVKQLLALPRFCPGDDASPLGDALDTPGTRFFWLQKRLELSKRRVHAAASSVLLLGDISACDVFLVLIPQQSPAGEKPSLTVWGSAHRKSRDDRRRASTASDRETEAGRPSSSPADDLFFIAHRVEDYWRLAAVFGWVYGWQLAYSAHGAPLRSLAWLRFFNASALEATQLLHQ